VDPVTLSVAGAIIVVLLLLFILAGLRVVNQYERGVIFVLGRLRGAKGPGVFWVPPFISTMRKIDLRIVTIELQRDGAGECGRLFLRRQSERRRQ
jgi:regulator of protease activity HflC (stomatin/prohibitin superfamily)